MALKHLIPPKIASPSAIGAAGTAQRMVQVVDFYSRLPKGPANLKQAGGSGPFAWYKRKYFDGENASGAPIVHLIVGLFLFGYTVDYNRHLKHHKNNIHH